MSVLASAIAHGKARPKGSIEIPEWLDEDGRPVVLTWSPLLMEQFQIGVAAVADKNFVPAIKVIVDVARKPDGSRAFDPGDQVTLKQQADPAILLRIIGAMIGGAAPADMAGATEAAEKN